MQLASFHRTSQDFTIFITGLLVTSGGIFYSRSKDPPGFVRQILPVGEHLGQRLGPLVDEWPHLPEELRVPLLRQVQAVPDRVGMCGGRFGESELGIVV